MHGHLLGSDAIDQLDPRIVDRRASSITQAQYQCLLESRTRLHAALPGALGHGFVVCPTVKFVAPRLDDLLQDAELFSRTNEMAMRNTRLFSFLDMPAIAIPRLRRDGQLPAILMIAAAPRRDVALLQLARKIEPRLRAADICEKDTTRLPHPGELSDPQWPARNAYQPMLQPAQTISGAIVDKGVTSD